MANSARDIKASVDKALEDDKDIPLYRSPGRPPRAPKNKLGLSIRAMITPGVDVASKRAADIHAIIQSNYLRLAIYNQLKADGMLQFDMPNGGHIDLTDDATFDDIRKMGLI